jgi:hypothetical protein
MKITVAHKRTKAEIMQNIERSFDDLARPNAGLPVQLTVKSKSWQGSVLTFELAAKMAMVSTPIKGTVEVTDTDVIIEADLGMLGRFVSDETAAQLFGQRFKGLLN